MGVHVDDDGHVTVLPDPDEADERVHTESMAFVAGAPPDATIASKMRSETYHEGYWERGEGSNYWAYGDDPGWPVTADVLQQILPVEARILEIACAKGWFVHAARRAGLECWGIDISEYAVAHAPESMRPYLMTGNAVDLPYDDGQFTVVCSWEFLEHVYEDEIDRVLDEMQRVGTPGHLQVHRIGIDMEQPGDYAHQQQDVTHVLEMPRAWWHDKFTARGWTRVPDVEERFDAAFAGRDWVGRYFAWSTPTT